MNPELACSMSASSELINPDQEPFNQSGAAAKFLQSSSPERRPASREPQGDNNSSVCSDPHLPFLLRQFIRPGMTQELQPP